MAVELIVYQALAASGVAAYVADVGSPTPFRIYPEAAPQATLYPLVVYRIVGHEPVACLDGSSNLARTVVQVDCYALTLLTALAMADAVALAMFGNFATFKGIAQARRNGFDENERVYYVSQDFAVWA